MQTLQVRPVSITYACHLCGQLHRLRPSEVGHIVRTPCGRGQVEVAMVIADREFIGQAEPLIPPPLPPGKPIPDRRGRQPRSQRGRF